MIKTITKAALLWLAAGSLPLFSQTPGESCQGSLEGLYLHANNVRAYINNSGGLFFDGQAAAFQVPYEPEGPGTIFAQGLWLGAIGPGDTLKIAAPSYGAGRGEYDYFPGPLPEGEPPGAEYCENWARVWTVFRHQIERHRADFEDNGLVNNPDSVILSWPGQGNPHFEGIYGFPLPERPQGLAPFADVNEDGNYTPLAGDYPMILQSEILPEQITWSIYNDAAGEHTDSRNTEPLKVEVHLTTWAFNCQDNPPLNHTIFTSYKLINRGAAPLDSLHLSSWINFDLGCFQDDYVGSAPALNTLFAYNMDNTDGQFGDSCAYALPTYGENPPVQAMAFLNRPLAYANYYRSGAFLDGPPGMYPPATATEYYRYMSGRWRDGSPLTFGDDGYQEGQPTDFVFPDDPNGPNGWSMQTIGLPVDECPFLGTIKLGSLAPETSVTVDVAYAYFREPGNNHLENVTAMYTGVEQLQGWYDNRFSGACNEPLSEVDTPTPIPNITVFPNPTRGQLELRFPGQHLSAIELLDARSRRVWQGAEGWRDSASLNFAQLPAGVYFLRAGGWVEKVVIGR